jgi:hypothetical protein
MSGAPSRRAAALRVASLGLFALYTLVGCYPVTRMQVPRTTPRGKVLGAISMAAPLLREPLGPDAEHANYPQLEGALRMGLTHRIDVGLRLRATAVEIGPKFQIVRDVVEVSIAPAFLYARDEDALIDEEFASDTRVVAARVSVYVGSSLDYPVAFFVAPTVDAGTRTDGVAGTQPLVLPGTMIGAVFSPAPTVHLLLEVGMLFPVAGPRWAVTGTQWAEPLRLGPGDNRVELGIGLLFGRFD